MPKRNRKKVRKLHFTESDKLLAGLEEVAKAGQNDAEAANSLKLWYLEHKSWTEKQWLYAKAIVSRHGKKGTRAKKERKYYLYAISDGSSVKLGYSCNIKGRLSSIQTGHPSQLKCVWRYYTGKNEKQAQSLERKLHRCCKKYGIRGEWFKLECMHLVEQFSIKEKCSRDRSIEEQELEILAAAQERI